MQLFLPTQNMSFNEREATVLPFQSFYKEKLESSVLEHRSRDRVSVLIRGRKLKFLHPSFAPKANMRPYTGQNRVLITEYGL